MNLESQILNFRIIHVTYNKVTPTGSLDRHDLLEILNPLLALNLINFETEIPCNDNCKNNRLLL